MTKVAGQLGEGDAQHPARRRFAGERRPVEVGGVRRHEPRQEHAVRDDELLRRALGAISDGVRFRHQSDETGRGNDEGIGPGRSAREQLEPSLSPPARVLRLLGDQGLRVELRNLGDPSAEQPEELLLDPAVPARAPGDRCGREGPVGRRRRPRRAADGVRCIHGRRLPARRVALSPRSGS